MSYITVEPSRVIAAAQIFKNFKVVIGQVNVEVDPFYPMVVVE